MTRRTISALAVGGTATLVQMQGGHHLESDYRALADAIIAHLPP